MANTRDKLNRLDRSIRGQWQRLDSSPELSTREKLDRLVRSRIGSPQKAREPAAPAGKPSTPLPPFLEREFRYPGDNRFGPFRIGELDSLRAADLAILAGDPEWEGVDSRGLLYFDTETTGLAGGTGTLAFMLGFGYLDEGAFQVRIFVLSDLNREGEFLERVDRFLEARNPSAAVTYNGKCFDYPLMETRYVLQRRRFPLLGIPHLDFLYPARTIWRHTYPTRRLGYLGDRILGLSREEDVDGAEIPRLYFDFLRSGDLTLLESVMDHNALDLLGLAMLVLVGARYIEDISHTRDEGEILGTARLLECRGRLEEASSRLQTVREMADRVEVQAEALRRLSGLQKKQKLYRDASALWEELRGMGDPRAIRELSIHYEHRERDLLRALELVRQALERFEMSPAQRADMQHRLRRLQRKVSRLDGEDDA